MSTTTETPAKIALRALLRGRTCGHLVKLLSEIQDDEGNTGTGSALRCIIETRGVGFEYYVKDEPNKAQMAEPKPEATGPFTRNPVAECAARRIVLDWSNTSQLQEVAEIIADECNDFYAPLLRALRREVLNSGCPTLVARVDDIFRRFAPEGVDVY